MRTKQQLFKYDELILIKKSLTKKIKQTNKTSKKRKLKLTRKLVKNYINEYEAK